MMSPSTPAPTALPHGTHLQGGAISIGRVLGQGGFGLTYHGADTRLHRHIAIKELFIAGSCHRSVLNVVPDADAAADFLKAKTRFLREAQALARFDSPNIVRVFSVFEEHGTAYIAMEFLEGQTLAQVLEQRHVLPQQEALDIIEEIANALETVHAAGLLHGDINPANVMICQGARVVLIDFGLVKSAISTTRYATQQLTSTTSLGTPGYAPLEQYGQGPLTPASDIYALAAIFYHLLAGKPPLAASARAAGDRQAPLHEVNPTLGLGISRAVEQALELDSRQRPQTVRAFLDALQQHTAIASTTVNVGSSAPAANGSGSTGIPTPYATPQQPSLPYWAEQEARNRVAERQRSLRAQPRPVIQEHGGDQEARIDLDTPVTADQANYSMLPVAVKASARVLDWPFECPCCGAEPDARFLSGFVMRNGHRVIHQPTDRWTIPYCSACAEHFYWAIEERAAGYAVGTALHAVEVARNAPVIPRLVPPPALAPPPPLPVAAPPPLPAPSSSGCAFVSSWACWITVFVLLWLVTHSVSTALTWTMVAAFFAIPLARWLDAQPVPVAAPAADAGTGARAVQQAQDDRLAVARRAYEAAVLQAQEEAETAHREAVAQAEQNSYLPVALANAWNEALESSRLPKCCLDLHSPVHYLGSAGSIHSLAFQREEYARQFVACNHAKVIFCEKRPLAWLAWG